MSDFLNQFKPDKEFPDERWSFTTPKLVLKSFVSAFAVYDEDFHKGKLENKPYPLEPSGYNSRVEDAEVPVFVFDKNPEATQLRENGWMFLLDNSVVIEERLRAKLLQIQQSDLTLLAEEIEDGGPFADHWKMIQSAIPDAEMQIDKFFKLVGIVLDSNGLEDHAFVGFEFQTSWDKDHGLEIVMHKDRVLARAGMTELLSGYGSSIDGIKATQEFDLAPGDFRLS
ncbi:MAG: hypothetical protein WCK51_13590 [Armatimonadota bacterium]